MEFFKNDAISSVQVVMNDHDSPKFKSKNFGPLRVTPDYRRGLKISLNKCPTYYYIDIAILTK